MELKTYFAQDAAGNIISSAIVNVFLQGTTTLATGLTRADGTPLENPFAADGAGRIQFRAPDGYYDVQVSAGPGIIQTLTIQCVDYSEAKADAGRAEAAADLADVSAEQAQNALNSITGINTNFEQNSREQWRRSLAEAGLTLVSGSFEEGATADSSTDAVWHIAGGQCYTWDGAFPKAVPADSTPETPGGIGLGKWLSVGDATLRTELFKHDGVRLIGTASYSEIRNYSGDADVILCHGIQNHNDGGEGVFYLDFEDSTSADNGGTILIDAQNRRWKRRYSGDVDIRWFGCKPDGVTDNYEPLNRAIQWACTPGNKVTFYVPKGVTYVSDTISTPGRYLFNMRGEGGLRDESGSIIKFATNKSLNLRGTNSDGTVTATYMQAFFEGIIFSGTDQALDSPVKLIDTVGVLFDKCTFTMCQYGLNLLNEFRWTESCVARNCYFTSKCTCAILYRVSSGNTYVSFYGSGLENCFLENSGNGSPKIQIAANAQPYNAPLNVTMGHTPDSTHPIIQHSGNVNSWFVGDIKVEVGEEYDCPLVGGSPLYIVGGLTSMGGRVTTQNAYFCYEVRQSVTGNAINFRRKPFSRMTQFTSSGGGLVWSYTPSLTPQTFKIYMTVATSFYSYEYELTMHTHYLNGTNGSVTVDKTFRSYDTNSIGAPSVEYSAGSTQAQLYVWRSGLPSGAVVFMDIVPVSSGFEYPML